MRRRSKQASPSGTSAFDPETDMDHIGVDVVGMGGGHRKIQEKRIRRGECPSCGVKCYQVNNSMFGKKTRVPLTIVGQVKEGVCLTCFPEETVDDNDDKKVKPVSVPPSAEFDVPHFIQDDDQTVVSNITLDHRLWQFPGEDQPPRVENRWNHESASPKSPRKNQNAGSLLGNNQLATEPPLIRPEPSYNNNATDIDNRPQMPRRKASDRRNLTSVEISKSFSTQISALSLPIAEEDEPIMVVDGFKMSEMALVEDVDEDEESSEESLDVTQETLTRRDSYYPPAMPTEVEESEHDENEIFFDSKSRLWEYNEGSDEEDEEETIEIPPNLRSPIQVGNRKSINREIAVDPRTLPIEAPPLVLASQPSLPRNELRTATRLDPTTPRPPTRQVTKSNLGPDLIVPTATIEAVPPTLNGTPLPSSSSPKVEGPRMPIRMESNRDVVSGRLSVASAGQQKSFASSTLTHSSASICTPMTVEADIPALLQSLEDAVDSPSRVAALEQLCGALVDVGAKQEFCEARGVSILNLVMWIDLADSEVQQMCSDLLLALVAKADEKESDFLTGEDGQSVLDALLIVMQRLLDDADIQERGCRVLGCLARASAKNNAVPDGSTTGAVLTVLNAMEAHSDSKSVVEWGVRTLYEFCARSCHAAANKRSMWSQSLGSGVPGWFLLTRALTVAPEDTVGLLWVLSSDQNSLEHLQPADEIVAHLFRLVQRFQKDRLSALLLEASLGCISNFASIEANLSQVDSTDVCFLALGLIPSHMRSRPSLCKEACAAVSTLACRANKSTLVEQGGIDDLCLAMTDLHDDEVLHEEAALAMLALIKDSSQAKQAVTNSTTFSTIMKLIRMYEGSAQWQTTACQFFASMFAMDGILPSDIERDGLNAVCFAMTLHSSNEQVQEAGCVALSNLSGRPGGMKVMEDSEAVELALLAMHQFSKNLTIQIMSCIILWNAAYVPTDKDEINVVQCLVKAVQNHIESERLLEVACGAILHSIYGSNANKTIFAEYGGVEAIGCALVMYSSRSSVLEKVCEVMASLSACSSVTKFIVEAHGVANMIEAMRGNDSIKVLRSAALFLKNVVVAAPQTCEDAARGITGVVNSMQTHRDDSDLQREACNYLWSIAALSEDGKSKILALDGISVVMETMEIHQDSADVQQAALGVFHELALEASA